MADEDVKGTSADAEEPTEDEQVETPAEEAAEATAEPSPSRRRPTRRRPRSRSRRPKRRRPRRRPTPSPLRKRRRRAGRGACGRDEPAAEEPGAAEEPAAAEAAPATGPKPKRKRLPRALRPKKTRPTRVRSTERKPIVRLEAPDARAGPPPGAPGQGGLRRDGEDHRRRGLGREGAPQVQEGRAPKREVPRPRRAQRGEGGRSRPHRRDAPALPDEALAPRRRRGRRRLALQASGDDPSRRDRRVCTERSADETPAPASSSASGWSAALAEDTPVSAT